MLIDIQEQEKMSGATDLKTVEKAVRSALLRAQAEKRITLGLHQAVKNLQASPDEGLFCFLAPPKSGDLATQMNEVLLQAFCVENDIYVIKVDSSAKLSCLLGSHTIESCAVIHKTWCGVNGAEDVITNVESMLVDHCENCWDAIQQPVIKLPEK